MVSDTTSLGAAAVLAAARRSRREADLAEAAVLASAIEWGVLHVVSDARGAATWVTARGEDTGVALGGVGVPLVSEFAVPELASALGMSTDAGRSLLADALELAYRLPRVWARVQSGDLQAWRARRIAAGTQLLSAEGAEFVDRQVAAFAHRVGAAQLQRLVDEAVARFMPDTARERQRDAADGRHFDIDHDQVSFNGTSRVHGELDLADALDLEAAIAAGAEELKGLGCDESLDVRRSRAAGQLARDQLALDLQRDTGPEAECAAAPRRRATGRQVVLHVHLSEQAVRSRDASAPARVENAGGHLVTAGQVAAWCGVDTSRVVVKPVIDLNEHIHVTSYEVPDRLREQVALRDQTCVFPWCTRPARRCHPDEGRGCDDDHVVPHARGGSTCSGNLAPLCRRHHRLKTHGRWTYTSPEPGTYLWSSPHGYAYLRDHTGTQDLTDLPVDPPDT
ncbi:MAG TPA: DUF222 domain-containing protein [Marmoricola sp.]|nr:DUF222 domain-containing protein [Marmoricola sp.]